MPGWASTGIEMERKDKEWMKQIKKENWICKQSAKDALDKSISYVKAGMQ